MGPTNRRQPPETFGRNPVIGLTKQTIFGRAGTASSEYNRHRNFRTKTTTHVIFIIIYKEEIILTYFMKL